MNQRTGKPVYLLFAIVLFFQFSALFSATEVTFPQMGTYELQQRIGQGAFSFIYSARNKSNGHMIAIKIYHRERAYMQELKTNFSILNYGPGSERFLKFLALGQATHIEESDRSLFRVDPALFGFELLDGTLKDVMMSHSMAIGNKHGTMDLISDDKLKLRTDRLMEISVQLLKIWEALAFRRCVHGDIKPDNIGMVRNKGEISLKLIDLASIVTGPLGHEYGRPLNEDGTQRFIYYSKRYASWETRFYNEMPQNTYYSHWADFHAITRNILYMACDFCEAGQFEKMVARIASRLKDNETNRDTIAKLHFLSDLVVAGSKKYPKQRMESVLNSDLSKVIYFLDGEVSYEKFKPVTPQSSEFVVSVYRPTVDCAHKVGEICKAFIRRIWDSCRDIFKRIKPVPIDTRGDETTFAIP